MFYYSFLVLSFILTSYSQLRSCNSINHWLFGLLHLMMRFSWHSKYVFRQVILIITSEIYNIVVLIHSINVFINNVLRLDWIETGMFWSPLCSNIYEMSCEFDERRSFLVEHHQLANLRFVLAVYLEVMGWPWGTYVLEYGLCVTYQQLV